MTDPSAMRTTLSTSGGVVVRQRPSLLLMKIRLRAAEPTLELGLAKLKAQCESASPWLKRLGADRVELGEPHFDDQTDKDPLTRIRANTAKAMMGKKPAGNSPGSAPRGVNVVVTATWNVASKSAAETLVLWDQLRFEATQDVEPAEAAEEPPSWSSPEEQQMQQLRTMMTNLHQPPADDGVPQFLCISRLNDEQMEKALAEAFARARQNAERLARAAGMRLGRLSTAHFAPGAMDHTRHDKLMERQRCVALLAGTSYELKENEIVSDDPRFAEFLINVGVNYVME